MHPMFNNPMNDLLQQAATWLELQVVLVLTGAAALLVFAGAAVLGLGFASAAGMATAVMAKARVARMDVKRIFACKVEVGIGLVKRWGFGLSCWL